MDLCDINHLWIFLVALPIIAFLYSSVGHGGASGYLALMALFNFSPEIMRPTALLLNLFVSGIAFYYYWKEGYFNKKLFIPFALASIPLAYIGGMTTVEISIYKKVLAILLVFAILRMLNIFGKEHYEIKGIKFWLGMAIGAPIGFFSGLIGIGGGIILTPIILLLHWGKMKEAAAVSALFIWVNSAAGLFGVLGNEVAINKQSFLLVILAFIGGYFGAYLGSKKFNNRILRRLLAVVLVIASLKLFFA